MRECSVCWTDTADYIKCTDVFCTGVLCYTCLNTYLDAVRESRGEPHCCVDKCPGMYRYSSTRQTLDGHAQAQYEAAIFALLMPGATAERERQREVKQIISHIRDARQEFLQRGFPPGVLQCARLVFPARLNRVNMRKTKAEVESRRRCMTLTCPGFLDDGLQCTTCTTVFCADCETPKAPDHRCRPEDIASITAIRGMQQCPSCHLRVERSRGCDNMTCASCGTKFSYSTGRPSHGGGHSTMVRVRTAIKLSDGLTTALTDAPTRAALIDLEALEPPAYNRDGAVQALLARHPPTQEFDPALARELCRIYERDMVVRARTRMYYRITKALEQQASRGAITVEGVLRMTTQLRSIAL